MHRQSGRARREGIPEHLPTPIQFGGIAYVFARAEASEDVGTLTRIGCIGPFELASTDQADADEVLYLRTTGAGADDLVYRFEAAPTFKIEFQVTERPQVISTGDQRYRMEQVWQPSVYSSTSVILFVEDPADPAPEVIYGLDVSDTAVGDAIGEYRLPDDSATPEEITAAAEEAGLNPDLTINGQTYNLIDVYRPTGTTSNGFITLFGTPTEGHRKCCSVAISESQTSSSSFSKPPSPPADRRGADLEASETSIAMLVLYVDHIGRSLRVSALIELVGNDTRRLLDVHYPERLVAEVVDPHVITAPKSGVLTGIDRERLVDLASDGHVPCTWSPHLVSSSPLVPR